MDMATILDTLTPTTLGYFLVGAVVGYCFRVYQPNFRTKRPGRYETKKSDSASNRTAVLTDIKEPVFDLPDTVLKTFIPQRMTGITVDQNGNEIQ